jgi:hypothetical protein
MEGVAALKTLLKSQGISLSTNKAKSSQLCQGRCKALHDLGFNNSSLIQQNKGGRRLAGLGHKP